MKDKLCIERFKMIKLKKLMLYVQSKIKHESDVWDLFSTAIAQNWILKEITELRQISQNKIRGSEIDFSYL